MLIRMYVHTHWYSFMYVYIRSYIYIHTFLYGRFTYIFIAQYRNETIKIGFTSVPYISSQPDTARFQSAC